jgi:capsular polysaccharide biosynthesis protein
MSENHSERGATQRDASFVPLEGRPMRGSDNRTNRDEVALSEVLAVIHNGRWLILAITGICAAIALTFAFILPKKYRATILVAPVSTSHAQNQLAGLVNAVPGVAGLASTFGISGHGGDGSNDVATLESQILTRKFIAANDLMPILFASEWNERTHNWRSSNPKKVPTLWDANALFKSKIRTVMLDEKSGLIKLSVVWNNPVLAASWANGLVETANHYLRARAIRRSKREIKYLNDQAQRTSVVVVRQGIYNLMQREIASEMVAKGQREYALRVIDPAYAPETPASPRPLLWALSGIIGGFLFSCGWVIFRAGLRESRR